MKTSDALNIVSKFKGENLKQNLNQLKSKIVGKGKNDILELNNVYEAALEVKKLSAQIDEIVHASGIIKCLPLILIKGEIVINLSLAAGADGEGIDLVTNKRIAEFKFARWQIGAANGMRKRQVFSDLVNLYLNPSPLKKELYVFNSEKIISFFQSNRSSWRKVLSKSGGLDKELEIHLAGQKIVANHLNDIYSISNVTVIDIDDIFK